MNLSQSCHMTAKFLRNVALGVLVGGLLAATTPTVAKPPSSGERSRNSPSRSSSSKSRSAPSHSRPSPSRSHSPSSRSHASPSRTLSPPTRSRVSGPALPSASRSQSSPSRTLTAPSRSHPSPSRTLSPPTRSRVSGPALPSTSNIGPQRPVGPSRPSGSAGRSIPRPSFPGGNVDRTKPSQRGKSPSEMSEPSVSRPVPWPTGRGKPSAPSGERPSLSDIRKRIPDHGRSGPVAWPPNRARPDVGKLPGPSSGPKLDHTVKPHLPKGKPDSHARANVRFPDRVKSGQLDRLTGGKVAQKIKLADQYKMKHSGDVARRLHLHDRDDHWAKIAPGIRHRIDHRGHHGGHYD